MSPRSDATRQGSGRRPRPHPRSWSSPDSPSRVVLPNGCSSPARILVKRAEVAAFQSDVHRVVRAVVAARRGPQHELRAVYRRDGRSTCTTHDARLVVAVLRESRAARSGSSTGCRPVASPARCRLMGLRRGEAPVRQEDRCRVRRRAADHELLAAVPDPRAGPRRCSPPAGSDTPSIGAWGSLVAPEVRFAGLRARGPVAPLGRDGFAGAQIDLDARTREVRSRGRLRGRRQWRRQAAADRSRPPMTGPGPD